MIRTWVRLDRLTATYVKNMAGEWESTASEAIRFIIREHMAVAAHREQMIVEARLIGVGLGKTPPVEPPKPARGGGVTGSARVRHKGR